jgi:hypothetical protein
MASYSPDLNTFNHYFSGAVTDEVYMIKAYSLQAVKTILMEKLPVY